MKRNLAVLLAGVFIAELISPFFVVNAQPVAQPNRLAFTVAGTNGFTFDTGVLRGRLRADGRSKGLSAVEHIASGTMVDRSRVERSKGLLAHYRVFTTGRRYGGGAWDWQGEAKLQADGSVEVRWPATDDRAFVLSAHYRWAAPDTLDVVTTVATKTNLAGFELFLASYFDDTFTNALVYVADLPGRPGVAGFLAAEPSLGDWLAFPRDDAAVAIRSDGRWTLPPSPIEWVRMPRMAKPLGIRRHPSTGLTALLMSPPGDAFALCTPHQTEGHYSMYISLFGRDLKAGETAHARARLLIVEQVSDVEAVRAYESYLKDLGGT